MKNAQGAYCRNKGFARILLLVLAPVVESEINMIKKFLNQFKTLSQ